MSFQYYFTGVICSSFSSSTIPLSLSLFRLIYFCGNLFSSINSERRKVINFKGTFFWSLIFLNYFALSWKIRKLSKILLRSSNNSIFKVPQSFNYLVNFLHIFFLILKRLGINLGLVNFESSMKNNFSPKNLLYTVISSSTWLWNF